MNTELRMSSALAGKGGAVQAFWATQWPGLPRSTRRAISRLLLLWRPGLASWRREEPSRPITRSYRTNRLRDSRGGFVRLERAKAPWPPGLTRQHRIQLEFGAAQMPGCGPRPFDGSSGQWHRFYVGLP